MLKYLVLDTNILLADANNLLTLGRDPNVIIVLPETVLAELDAKKSGFEEINYQARAAARILSGAGVKKISQEKDYTCTHLQIGVQTILVVSLRQYTADPSEYGGNDQRIIEVAKVFDNVELMSIDFYMRLRAQAVGLRTSDLKIVDDTECEFVKEYEVENAEMFRTLHDTNIYVVNPAHKPEHYSYKFTCDSIGQMKLATIVKDRIKVLGKDTEQDLRQQDCPPVNSEQLLASKAIQDPTVDLVLIEGQAGSGKNIVALSNAICLLRTAKNKYQQIIYMRNPINDEQNGEEIGFLSGNDEKYAVYLGPIEDTIDFIVRQKTIAKSTDKAGSLEVRVQERIEELKAECNLEAIITTGLRGRTFHNAVIILDEWQNTNQATAQKALTRVGKNCKVIVLGSQKQIDSKYVTKYNNGLAILMNEARNRVIDTEINMFAIELKKVVRSEMALFAEELFTKHKG